MNRHVFDFAEKSEVDSLSQTILNYTVVFVADQLENSVCLGSGTLLKFGGVFGILTCGHVLKALRNRARVRVSLHTPNSQHRVLNSINLGEGQFISIGENYNGKVGPDLGFLRVDQDAFEMLNAKMVFLDGDVQHAKAKVGAIDRGLNCDYVCGSVEELNTKIGSSIQIAQQINAGIVKQETTIDGTFDYFNFGTFDLVPQNISHQGTSGGGWWRLTFEKSKNGALEIVERNLLGVAFGENGETPNVIIGHGPRSIYENLRKRVLESFAL